MSKAPQKISVTIILPKTMGGKWQFENEFEEGDLEFASNGYSQKAVFEFDFGSFQIERGTPHRKVENNYLAEGGEGRSEGHEIERTM